MKKIFITLLLSLILIGCANDKTIKEVNPQKTTLEQIEQTNAAAKENNYIVMQQEGNYILHNIKTKKQEYQITNETGSYKTIMFFIFCGSFTLGFLVGAIGTNLN